MDLRRPRRPAEMHLGDDAAGIDSAHIIDTLEQLLANHSNDGTNVLKSNYTFSCLQQAGLQTGGIYYFFSASLNMGYYRRETTAV